MEPEGISVADLDIGPAGGTGERFECAVYIGHSDIGHSAEDRGPKWIVRTVSGWSMPLETVLQNDPVGGELIRRRVISQTYGLYSPP